jgi:hypothetical protein
MPLLQEQVVKRPKRRRRIEFAFFVTEEYLEFISLLRISQQIIPLYLMQPLSLQKRLVFALFNLFCWTCVLYVGLYRLINVSSQRLPWNLPSASVAASTPTPSSSVL